MHIRKEQGIRLHWNLDSLQCKEPLVSQNVVHPFQLGNGHVVFEGEGEQGVRRLDVTLNGRFRRFSPAWAAMVLCFLVVKALEPDGGFLVQKSHGLTLVSLLVIATS